MKHFISIICPIYNEEKFIENCINSILKQNYSKESMEVLFVDGMSTDGTREIVLRYVEKYSNIFLLDNVDKVVPFALNIGIRNSRGDVIIRIDGHCVYPQNYVSTLVKYLFELNVDNVGAVWNTLPANSSTECVSIALASSHAFGVGGSKHKIGVHKIIETDTVPFGCYKKEVFDRIGLFDEDLIRNQDDELNARLIKVGGKIFLIPDLVIDYTARDSIKKMSKMYYQYGLFKPLVNKKVGAPATIRQFFPALFLIGLVGGGLLSFFSNILLGIYLIIIILYFSIGFCIGIRKAIAYKNYKLSFYLPFTFFVIHISYGYGYWAGIYKILTKSKFVVHINR